MGPFDWCRWLRNDTQKGHYIEGETPRSPPTILLVSQFQALRPGAHRQNKGTWSHFQESYLPTRERDGGAIAKQEKKAYTIEKYRAQRRIPSGP